jgi:hypothetical protein
MKKDGLGRAALIRGAKVDGHILEKGWLRAERAPPYVPKPTRQILKGLRDV